MVKKSNNLKHRKARKRVTKRALKERDQAFCRTGKFGGLRCPN